MARGRYKTIQHHEEKLIALVRSGELEIDDDGRIWRVKERKGHLLRAVTRRRAETQPDGPGGYLFIHAMFNGKTFLTTAQRLVWLYFNGSIPTNLTVNVRGAESSSKLHK